MRLPNKLFNAAEIRVILVFTLVFLIQSLLTFVYSQAPMPFAIENNSEFSDDELYIAIVGQANNAHIWVDMKTGNQLPMDPSYNTVQGPIYNGEKGPGGNGMYADCFTKLSEIPNKQVMLSPIYGCRMFIAMKSQLYLYFFGSTGATVGYASPSHTNPNDPSHGINYELIELTYNNIGFWGNTSRVDSYNYAMALELTSQSDDVLKTGEMKLHHEIGQAFLDNVPSIFHNCYNPTTGQILQPTKTPEFADGTIGGVPAGPHKDYMQPYIDEIWEKYKTEDLIFEHPEIGRWSGRVTNERFVFTCVGGNAAGFIDEKGVISGRPNTQEALEGKGVLDQVNSNARFDLMMQAQVCAALTRHVIDTDAPAGTVQDWGDPSTYYQESPCNHYAKFWHMEGIRFNQMAYGFAYDDVYEQSSTLHSPQPKSLKVVFGGYVKQITEQQPYSGTPIHIPGTLQSENYDLGGEGMAFHDSDLSNSGGAYRIDAVDVEENGQSGYSLGYIEDGEWLEYTIEVSKTATYQIKAQVANGGNNNGQFELLLDDNRITTSNNISNTGGWQNWSEITLGEVELSQGEYVLKFLANQGGFNFDEISFSEVIAVNQAPTVTIINPSNNSVFTSPTSVTITANAQDVDGGVTKVEFYNGSQLLGTDNSAPYSFNWQNVAAGNYTITAKAYDDETSTTSLAVTITVVDPIIPNETPTVEIISPTSSEDFIVGSIVNIEANAQDSDGSIQKVELYINDQLIDEDTQYPYTFDWSADFEGEFEILVVGIDNEGTASNSEIITISAFEPVAGLSHMNYSAMLLYPNPANNKVNIHCTAQNQELSTVLLYDMNGKLIKYFGEFNFLKGVNSYQFDLENIEVGTYILQISGKGGVYSNMLTVTN